MLYNEDVNVHQPSQSPLHGHSFVDKLAIHPVSTVSSLPMPRPLPWSTPRGAFHAHHRGMVRRAPAWLLVGVAAQQGGLRTAHDLQRSEAGDLADLADVSFFSGMALGNHVCR